MGQNDRPIRRHYTTDMADFTYINDLLDFIIENDLAAPNELLGCSETEVNAIQQAFGLPLPAAYREFLTALGRGTGRPFVGFAIFVNHPGYNEFKSIAFDIVVRESGLPQSFLKPSMFVFWLNQGYEFLCFDVEHDQPDPPVLCYTELDSAYVPFAPTLSTALFKLAMHRAGIP